MKKKDIVNETIELPMAEENAEEVKDKALPNKKVSKKIKEGSIVTIRTTTKRFCDGLGVPEYARNTGLRVKRVNPNGTVVLVTGEDEKKVGVALVSDVELFKGEI